MLRVYMPLLQSDEEGGVLKAGHPDLGHRVCSQAFAEKLGKSARIACVWVGRTHGGLSHGQVVRVRRTDRKGERTQWLVGEEQVRASGADGAAEQPAQPESALESSVVEPEEGDFSDPEPIRRGALLGTSACP
ncbi:hypothetical protein NKG05_16530 [Oerskovia sp. M15]